MKHHKFGNKKRKKNPSFNLQKFGKVDKRGKKLHNLESRWLYVYSKASIADNLVLRGRIEVYNNEKKEKKHKPIQIEKAAVVPMDRTQNEPLISLKEDGKKGTKLFNLFQIIVKEKNGLMSLKITELLFDVLLFKAGCLKLRLETQDSVFFMQIHFYIFGNK